MPSSSRLCTYPIITFPLAILKLKHTGKLEVFIIAECPPLHPVPCDLLLIDECSSNANQIQLVLQPLKDAILVGKPILSQADLDRIFHGSLTSFMSLSNALFFEVMTAA